MCIISSQHIHAHTISSTCRKVPASILFCCLILFCPVLSLPLRSLTRPAIDPFFLSMPCQVVVSSLHIPDHPTCCLYSCSTPCTRTHTHTHKVADVVLCQSISADGSTSKRLVIMDEVDGMGGSDRGGIPELIKVFSVLSLSIFQWMPISPPITQTQALYLFLSFFLSFFFSHYFPPTHSLTSTLTLPASLSH